MVFECFTDFISDEKTVSVISRVFSGFLSSLILKNKEKRNKQN